MAKKTLREYQRIFEDLGVEFVEKFSGGGHIHYTVVHLGKSRQFTFSASSSDHRNLKNNRASVARFKRDVEKGNV